jgi:hypothetical protein
MRNASIGVFVAASILCGSSASAQKTEAFQNAVDAYVYGYPLVTMEMTRRVSTNVATPSGMKAPMGQFAKLREYPAASNHTVTAPNADTLYTLAWFDVSHEPWVVTIPAMGNRYYLAPMLNGWTEVFANPGTRTTGDGARTIAITGPGWQGELPAGISEWKSGTGMVWLLGRIYSTGTKQDLDEVHALQDQFKATPLGAYGKNYQPPEGKVDPKIDMKTAVRDQVDAMDAGTYFSLLAQLMANNPPTAADAPMVAKMKAVGIVPGQAFDPKLASKMRAVPGAGQEQVKKWLTKDGIAAGDFIEQNGWLITKVAGNYGTDYMQRAAVTAIGLGANKPEDATYPSSTTDVAGKTYSGANHYVMHFAAGQMPPVQGFWSLTMYDPRFFFVPNPLNRYTVSERDHLKTNKDGSVDLYIQHDSPGKDLEANWLPAPADRFTLMLRMYWPSLQPPTILDGSWQVPPVARIQRTAKNP